MTSHSIPDRRPTSRRLHRAGALLLAVLSASCADLAGLVAPGRPAAGEAARVALTATIPLAARSAGDVVSLDVRASYLRADRSTVPLGNRSMPLANEAVQAVPISFELQACLVDANRDRSGGESACPVMLDLALAVNGVVVDRQRLGPLSLSPGGTTSVADAVALFEITGVDVAVGGGPVLGPSAEVAMALGAPLALRATIRERTGGAVPGREVTWTSDAPTIAVVDAQGVVTAVGPGLARITAAIEAVSRTVPVRVSRPPVLLSVVGDVRSGAGTVRSTPAGIECEVGVNGPEGRCSAPFPDGTTVTLRAMARTGSAFLGWGPACLAATGELCTLAMTAALEVSSRFSALRQLVVRPAGDGPGRVTGPAGLDCVLEGAATSGRCEVLVPEGTTATLTAVAGGSGISGAAATFAGWEDCPVGEGTTCRVAVGAVDRAVGVAFRDGRLLRVKVEGSGEGSVTSVAGLGCVRSAGATNGTCSVLGRHGSAVTVLAKPEAQSRFDGWSGACAGHEGLTCTVLLDAARDVSASFTALRRLTVTPSGDGRGRVRGPAGLDCVLNGVGANGTCTVTLPAGTEATLVATEDVLPARPQTFAGWGGDCAAATGPTCVLPPSGATRAVSVRFRDAQRLSLGILGTGAGRVESSPASLLSCVGRRGVVTGACAVQATFGTTVILMATPEAGTTFDGWTGGCTAAGPNACLATMDVARDVSARFTRSTVGLTLQPSGTGSGTLLVNGQPACALAGGVGQASCVTQVDLGASVTISAAAGAGSTFAGLSGDCAGNSCVLIPSGPQAVRARFDLQFFPVTLVLTGTGAGTATLDGAPFCSLSVGQGTASCTSSIGWGRTIQLSATPAAGNVGGSFSGACLGMNPCAMQVTSASQVGAQFDVGAPITVSPSGLGGGRVTATEGIACVLAGGVVSGSCTALGALGSTMVLTAVPDGTSTIGTWGGACLGQVGPTCQVRTVERRTVTIRFDPVP